MATDVFWIFVLVCVYFTPTVLALGRHVRQWDAVALVNLLAGWTVAGWAVAFWMAARMAAKPSRPLA